MNKSEIDKTNTLNMRTPMMATATESCCHCGCIVRKCKNYYYAIRKFFTNRGLLHQDCRVATPRGPPVCAHRNQARWRSRHVQWAMCVRPDSRPHHSEKHSPAAFKTAIVVRMDRARVSARQRLMIPAECSQKAMAKQLRTTRVMPRVRSEDIAVTKRYTLSVSRISPTTSLRLNATSLSLTRYMKEYRVELYGIKTMKTANSNRITNPLVVNTLPLALTDALLRCVQAADRPSFRLRRAAPAGRSLPLRQCGAAPDKSRARTY